ncbi:hypothetical protein AK830_g4684 [Neonectria ditissima]|uniref:Heterokaryon incompatibility domain-containing protein n=1 Tax=Neonectria ditissima TaxID=78410 RepID=A0A0P7AV56_9HYPO|nr:hypothetical protein AK830_g4684 [Neonectria ditissima]
MTLSRPRLVDVSPPQSKSPPSPMRVIITKEKHRKLPTNKDNVDEFATTGMPWKEIETNRNFVDAPKVTQKLDIWYIWIDSLCIIQEHRVNPSTPQPPVVGKKAEIDFERQGNPMHKVYCNSLCNIAVAVSSDKNGSLFQKRYANS